MNLLSLLKNVGSALATITTVVYLSGYLALRARAFTLGSDPAFALAYEGYVFAGVRFIFVSLIFLLMLSPVILLVNWLAVMVQGRLEIGVIAIVEWLLLALITIANIGMIMWVLGVNGVLLRPSTGGPKSLLDDAVMGGVMAEIITVAALFLTALTVLWFRRHLSAGGAPFTCVLGGVLLLEIFLLPILHGSLYADRKVRVLAATPSTAQGIREPIGVIDRNSDHVTLLGLSENGERRLVTIKLEDLNGIPVKRIVPLTTFVENDLSHFAGVKGGSMSAEKTLVAGSGTGYFKQLMSKLHLALENIGSLGESVVEEGEIWSVELDPAGSPAKAQPLCVAGNFSWPVFDPRQRLIYAIGQGRIYQIHEGNGKTLQIDQDRYWLKLFGVTEEGQIMGMVRGDNGNLFATRHGDGKVSLAPPSQGAEEQGWESSLSGENRVYSGNRSLLVDRSGKGGRGFDVYFKVDEKVFNVSNCGDDRCGQPSLSPDFRRILYVRKPAD